MTSIRNPETITVGLVAGEPIRMEGLASVFDVLPGNGHASMIPVMGSVEELLSAPRLDYLVLDLNSASDMTEAIEAARRARPDLQLIVLGPEGDDELVMSSIVAGARAYLDSSAGPEVVRRAIEAVTCGSIWAPRRLLSKLIDRLLKLSEAGPAGGSQHLTDRERQVLELILLAHSNREIAGRLGIEERTVKAHVGRLMRKTGTDNRIGLMNRAMNGATSGSLGAGTQSIDRRTMERRTGDRRQSRPQQTEVT